MSALSGGNVSGTVLQQVWPTYSPYMLRLELITDPLSIGYSGPLSRNDFVTVANLVDQVGSGANYTVWRNDVSPREVANNIQPADFIKMTTTQSQMLQVLFAGAPIDATQSGIRSNFGSVFSGAASTVSALTVMAQRQASRGEVLFGDGATINDSQIRSAIGLISGISG
jgi:hypothetical protein